MLDFCVETETDMHMFAAMKRHNQELLVEVESLKHINEKILEENERLKHSEMSQSNFRRQEVQELRRKITELEEIKGGTNIPKAIEILHSELGAMQKNAKLQEEVGVLQAQLQSANEQMRSWKEIAEEEMKAHAQIIQDKNDLEAELRMIRDYCTKVWGNMSASVAPVSRGSPTSDLCHRAIVMYNTSTFTADRTWLGSTLTRISKQLKEGKTERVRQDIKELASKLSANAMKPDFLSSPLPWQQFLKKLEAATEDVEFAQALQFLFSFVRQDYVVKIPQQRSFEEAEQLEGLPSPAQDGSMWSERRNSSMPPIDSVRTEPIASSRDPPPTDASRYSRHSSFAEMQRASLPGRGSFDDLSRYIQPAQYMQNMRALQQESSRSIRGASTNNKIWQKTSQTPAAGEQKPGLLHPDTLMPLQSKSKSKGQEISV
uniref:Uncharacterized protein n=1 Tax=Hanusia phi TaxID=3032 RepID=A0A7S0I0E9_9CRYP